MYAHHITDMVECLKKAGIVAVADQAAAAAALNDYWTDRVAIVWSVEDVLAVAEQKGYEITHDQAVDILQSIHDNHDAEYGISWQTINSYIFDYTAIPA